MALHLRNNNLMSEFLADRCSALPSLHRGILMNRKIPASGRFDYLSIRAVLSAFSGKSVIMPSTPILMSFSIISASFTVQA